MKEPNLKERVEGILKKVITRDTHKGTHARVVVQTASSIVELIQEDRKEIVERLREAVSASFYPWKKCHEGCKCNFCDVVEIKDRHKETALSAFDLEAARVMDV